MSWDKEQKKVAYLDEKKFNLDSPDGYNHYPHDLKKEPKQCFSRQMGKESIMVWGTYSHGLCVLNRILRLMNVETSAQYQAMFYNHLIPFGIF